MKDYWTCKGQLAIETHYLNGFQNGPMRYYTQDGKLKEEIIYEHDKEVKRTTY